jgi:2-C-methyl-D-erythritol 4-phosphate cytidylyltransferase
VSSVWALVVAAGSGSRFGRPKQFAPLCGRPVVAWAVDAARARCDGVVLVLPAAHLPPEPSKPDERFGADLVVAGGASRSASVRQGLAAVPADAEVIVVHDAARPLATAALFEAVLGPLADASVAGAVCAVPVADTLKRLGGAGSDATWRPVLETVDRQELVAVQTPQAFRADILRRAHLGEPEATDDAGLVEALGATVVVVPGDPANLKLTGAADLAYAEHLASTGRA